MNHKAAPVIRWTKSGRIEISNISRNKAKMAAKSSQRSQRPNNPRRGMPDLLPIKVRRTHTTARAKSIHCKCMAY